MAMQTIRYVSKPRGGCPASAELLAKRRAMDAANVALPAGIVVAPEIRGPGNAEWLTPSDSIEGATILFLHGSGYSKGSPASHRGLIASIVAASRATAFVADYRLTPEHPFPAALKDALAAYRFLLTRAAAADIVLVGDSAGGGLVLATLLAAHDEGLLMPAAAVTLSAWTDLAVTGPSTRSAAVDDPIVTAAMLRSAADLYLDGADPLCPYASPLYGDLAHLPPLLMQVGQREVMIDDTLRFAEKARARGVDVTVEVYEGMAHVFQLKHPTDPHSQRAIQRIGKFVNLHAAATSKVPSTAPAERHPPQRNRGLK